MDNVETKEIKEENVDIKISIIMPIYNAGEYLRQALDSVLSQSISDIELICIDDGSTDDSLRIIREYQERDARIRIVTENPRAIGADRIVDAVAAYEKYGGADSGKATQDPCGTAAHTGAVPDEGGGACPPEPPRYAPPLSYAPHLRRKRRV